MLNVRRCSTAENHSYRQFTSSFTTNLFPSCQSRSSSSSTKTQITRRSYRQKFNAASALPALLLQDVSGKGNFESTGVQLRLLGTNLERSLCIASTKNSSSALRHPLVRQKLHVLVGHSLHPFERARDKPFSSGLC